MRWTRGRYAVRLIAATGGITAFLALLTATLYLYNLRVDLSPGNRFTLSDHALAVLGELEHPVKITGFIRTQDARNPVLKDLLWQVANESPLVSYSVVDVNRNPSLAQQYGVDTYGAAVVESDGKRSDFTLPVESQLISAILNVTKPPKKVYALAGHGECDLASTDRHIGCSGMRDALQTEFYDVEPLRLFGGTAVPDDATVLLIIGPKDDPLPEEIEALDLYLRGGGKVVALLDPFSAASLAGLLTRYGIEPAGDVVIDPENRLGGGEVFSAAVTNVNRRHLVSMTLDSPPLFSGTRSLSIRPDEARGRTVSWLLKSGDRSWATLDAKVLRGSQPQFVAGRDINGPLTVAAEATMPALRRPDEEGVRLTRLLVFGDSAWVSNRFLDYLGNRDLLVNSVNWLAREESLIAPRSRQKTPGKNWLFISQAELRTMFLAAVVVQPGVFLLAGIAMLVRRRFKP